MLIKEDVEPGLVLPSLQALFSASIPQVMISHEKCCDLFSQVSPSLQHERFICTQVQKDEMLTLT
jgi:hypothetical protein